MKRKFTMVVIMAIAIIGIFAVQAYAEEVVPVVTQEIEVTGTDYYKDKAGKTHAEPVNGPESLAALSSGTAGSAASSGYRNASIKTTYSFAGVSTCSFTSKYYWTFSGGKVTYMRNNGRVIWVRNGFFYKLISYSAGGPTKMYWNGVWGGQQKCWQSATIRVSGPIVGEIYEHHPYHELYAHGNGTWYWKATE